jgi:hypothetical protein
MASWINTLVAKGSKVVLNTTLAIAGAVVGVLGGFAAAPETPVKTDVPMWVFNKNGVELGNYAIPSNAIPSNAIPSNINANYNKNFVLSDISKYDGADFALLTLFALPSSALPSSVFPLNAAIPSNALPSSALPSSALPSSFHPSLALPSSLRNTDFYHALPSSALPSSALPSSALPSSQSPVYNEYLRRTHFVFAQNKLQEDLTFSKISLFGESKIIETAALANKLPDEGGFYVDETAYIQSVFDIDKNYFLVEPFEPLGNRVCGPPNKCEETISYAQNEEVLKTYYGSEMALAPTEECVKPYDLSFSSFSGDLTKLTDISINLNVENGAVNTSDQFSAFYAASENAEQSLESKCSVNSSLNGITCPIVPIILATVEDFIVRVRLDGNECGDVFRMEIDLPPLQARDSEPGSNCIALGQATFKRFDQYSRSDAFAIPIVIGKALFNLPETTEFPGRFQVWSPHSTGLDYSQDCKWDAATRVLTCPAFYEAGTGNYILTYEDGACSQTVLSGNYYGSEMVAVVEDLSRCKITWPEMSLMLLNYRNTPPPDNLLDLYVKMPGGIPGLTLSSSIEDGMPWDYSIQLGNGNQNKCTTQSNYTDRLYCTVLPTRAQENTPQTFNLYLNGCKDPIKTFLGQYIPLRSIIPTPTATIPGPSTSQCPAGESYHGSEWGCCTDGCWCELDGEWGCWNNCPDCPPD